MGEASGTFNWTIQTTQRATVPASGKSCGCFGIYWNFRALELPRKHDCTSFPLIIRNKCFLDKIRAYKVSRSVLYSLSMDFNLFSLFPKTYHDISISNYWTRSYGSRLIQTCFKCFPEKAGFHSHSSMRFHRHLGI